MNTVVQSALSEVESKLNALLSTLTTSPTAAGAPAAAVALLEADDSLSSAISTLRQHQENYAKILQLRAEAERLEERVKGIVRDVEEFDKEIRTACGDDEDSDSELDFDDDETTNKPPRKEIDYRLLLDFARRISKYNQEAAADAANGAANPERRQASRPQIMDKDVTMAGTNGEPTTDGAEPVSSVTKNATQWLDDSANVTREVYMLPYPMEERIRMGLMAQVQLAAGDDPDKEVERLIREAEGLGAAEPPAPAPAADARQEEAATAAVQAGSAATGAPRPAASGFAPAPKPKPSATLDLDLYDPDDDDM
ncbi:Mediator complex subunit Med4 [Penicillium longicatenatum]|uniref:Mediator complex subunit Med4 n=1 Tax=Penicillium longicatenatum TaxID=1561947 RepID=UPI0025491026|nr:Mediator complex subunit Med4 [Penicillium longicatenatum]KAJ5657210.1 Mediator complex subunit Med4 [Penicillium longicatenatum]